MSEEREITKRRFRAPSRDQQAPEAVAARWDAASEYVRNLASRF